MKDRIKEQLSAFLDGELPEPESALLLKRLERDDDLRGALSRYSLIGAVLRSDGDVPAARQVAARVSAAIAREPRWPRPGLVAALGDRRWRPLAGFGLAATVAAAALLIGRQFSAGLSDIDAPLVAGSPAEPPAAALAAVEPVAPLPAYTTPAPGDGPGRLLQAQFANYLVAHSGYASPLVRRSLATGLIVAPGEASAPGQAGSVAATEPEAP